LAKAASADELGFASEPAALGVGEAPGSAAELLEENAVFFLEVSCVERLIGSVRRECLDHVIVINQTRLHGLLKAYFAYYHRSRTHLGLDKDAPEPRPVQGPEEGNIVAFPQLGGLHHRYERRAA